MPFFFKEVIPKVRENHLYAFVFLWFYIYGITIHHKGTKAQSHKGSSPVLVSE